MEIERYALRGTVKMWNADRGFGFIGDDAVARTYFCSVSARHQQSSIQTPQER